MKKLYVLVYKDEKGEWDFWRGNAVPKHNQSLRRNIRAYTTYKMAESVKKRNEAPEGVEIKEYAAIMPPIIVLSSGPNIKYIV